jgi:hypothetical protein
MHSGHTRRMGPGVSPLGARTPAEALGRLRPQCATVMEPMAVMLYMA